MRGSVAPSTTMRSIGTSTRAPLYLLMCSCNALITSAAPDERATSSGVWRTA